jgi:hypothetical protein
MNFLLYEKYTFTTDMGKGQILLRLRENTIPFPPLITVQENRLRFHGHVDDDGSFVISPVLVFDPAKPAIIGTVKDLGEQREVHIKISPALYILLIPLIFFGLFAFVMHNNDDTIGLPAIIFLFTPTLFFYAIILGGFNHQSRRCKKFLSDLLQLSQPVS